MANIRRNGYFISAITLATFVVMAAEIAFANLDKQLPNAIEASDYLYDGTSAAAVVELGRNLFFDPILSGNRNISCGTCHDPAFGSGDGLALGIGEGGTGSGPERYTQEAVTGRVPRNAQPLWNIGAKEYISLFHDGRVEKLDVAGGQNHFRNPAGDDLPETVPNVLAAQAFFPVTSPIEMAGQYGENSIANAAAIEDRKAVWDMLATRVAEVPGYFAMLRDAFPDLRSPDDVTFYDIAEALAAFQTTAFRSDNAPFDQLMRTGDASHLSLKAQSGLALFYGEAGCATCHSGPLLTDHKFHAIGVPQIGPGKGHGGDLSYFYETGLPGRQEDEGRYRVTFDKTDLFAFRTPSLRNVTLTGPWGHSGAFGKLEDVIRHHLDPKESLHKFDATSVALPELDQILRIAGRGTQLGFVPLEPVRRPDFDLRDTRVMLTLGLRSRISKAVQLDASRLSDEEIDSLIAFLGALTDPTARDRSDLVPETLPSGLIPQPQYNSPKVAN